LLYQGDRAHPELRMSELPGWTEPGVVPTNIKRHHDFTLAAATHAFRRRLSIGMSGVLSMYNHDRQGQGTTGNMDFGLAAHASRWLVLGAAGRNLLPIEGVGEFPLTAVGGFRVHGQAGALAADVEWEDAATVPWSLCGGVERRVGRVPVVRAGWRWEGPERSHRFTTGFGAQGPEGSLDFGALIPVGPDEPTLGSTTWMFSMQLVAPTMDDPTL